MNLFKKKEYLLFSILFFIFLISILFLVGWPFCRLVLVFAFLFLFPGYLFSKIVFPRKSLSFFASFPLSYCLGFSLLVIPGTIAYFLRPNLDSFTIFYLLFVLTFFGLFFSYRKKIINNTKLDNRDLPTSSNLALNVFVGIIIIGSFVLMLRIGSHYGGDAVTHIGSARHFFISGVNPSDFMTGDGIQVVYGFNIWHLALALLSKLSFLEPAVAWFYLAALFAPLSLLAFYSLAKVIIQNEEAASVALLVHVLLKLGGEGFDRFIDTQVGWSTLGQWTTLAYPFPHSLYIFLPIALYLIWKYMYRQEKKLIWSAGFIVLAISAVHPLGLFSLFWAILCFIVFSWIFDGKKELKVFKKLFWGLILIPAPYILIKAVVYLQYRFSLGADFNQALSQTIDKDLSPFLIKVSGIFSFLNLNSILSAPKVAFGVSLSLIFLLVYLKAHRGAKFLFSNILMTLAARLNSILAPLLIKTISLNLAIRSASRWLFYLVGLSMGWLFYDIVSILRRLIILKLPLARRFQRIFSQGFLLFMVLFLTSGILFLGFFSFMGISSAQVQNSLIRGWQLKRQPNLLSDELTKFISENIPQESIILIDTEDNQLMQRIVALAGSYAFSTRPRLALAFAKFPPKERIQKANRLLSLQTNLKQTMLLLKACNVDYILIEKTKKKRIAKFRRFAILKRIFENQSFLIYKYLQI